MANITIRNLPDQTKEKLRIQAAKRGHSLESHIREILNRASETQPEAPLNLFELAQSLFGATDGIDLELPKRDSKREIVDFGS